MNLSLAFLLGILTFFHIGILSFKNKSTIEFCENKRDKD